MTDATGTASEPAPGRPPLSLRRLIAATEIDVRLFGMLVALIAILLGFGLVTGGKFLQPTTFITLSVQTAVVAIMATGMVLIIVSRNIDLSVGSIVGVVAMAYALLMTDWLPHVLGIAVSNPLIWVIALVCGLALGAAIGAFEGFIIAYVGVPSFIVTLGGLLALRGVVWLMSSGAAVAGLDPTFDLLGGSAQGSIGGDSTWALAIVGCIASIGLLLYNRRQRLRFGFPLRPVWADVAARHRRVRRGAGHRRHRQRQLLAEGPRQQVRPGHGIVVPPGGLHISTGLPWPIIVVIAVTLLMTFVATRRRFGRYVYAYGGNPDAAELAGINTRWTIMKTLHADGPPGAASAAAVAVARQDSATLDVGQSDELYVIAAAVVGGTSFAGGIGTIPGAVLGAIVMQSLAYGLAFVGVNTPTQNIVAGIVLVVAVGLDSYNRRRGGGR